MEKECYAEYLLKHYKEIKREIALMEMDLEQIKSRERIAFAPDSGEIARICTMRQERTQAMSIKELEYALISAKAEMARLEVAIDSLEERVKAVIEDIYLHKLSWTQVCARRYISANTLNRYRKKGIRSIDQAMVHSTIGNSKDAEKVEEKGAKQEKQAAGF